MWVKNSLWQPLFQEIKRVLQNNGRYICISLLQEHIARTLTSNLSSQFAIQVIRCHEAEIKAKEQDESTMPVFIVVSTKFIKLQQPVRLKLLFIFFVNF